MKDKSTSRMMGGLAATALAIGCAADVGDVDSVASEGQVSPELKVAEEWNPEFEYIPEAEEMSGSKADFKTRLSAKGSATVPRGNTYKKPISIPPGGFVGCITGGGSNEVDPVLVLYRRHDNLHKEYPYTEKVWVQTLALNDDHDPPNRDASFTFTNTTGATLNAYLMAFAFANKTGQVDLWCHGIGVSETVTLAAGSVSVEGSSGSAYTTNSGGDPWLYQFDDIPLSYNGNWNDDTNGLESAFDYSGPYRTLWFVAHGWSSGSTTINY